VADRIDRLQRAVEANPDDRASRLLLARFLEADGDLHGALEQYDEVLKRDPTNAEAEAQAGRILYLTAEAAAKSQPDQVEPLVQQSRARLDHAVTLDPEYADARFFRAIVLANEYGDFPAAQNDLQRYLILAPGGPFANDARSLLAQVTNAIDGTPIPTTAPPKAKNDKNK
jgi:tetratricopeptide (TPR) repeat protein